MLLIFQKAKRMKFPNGEYNSDNTERLDDCQDERFINATPGN